MQKQWILLALLMMPSSLFPMYMNPNNLDMVMVGIRSVVIGCNDGDDAVFKGGIENLKRQEKNLKNMRFQQFDEKFGVKGTRELTEPSFFMKKMLKCLVLKGEHKLLESFLEVYDRSYPDAPMGVNFLYSTESTEPQTWYTLYDVAEKSLVWTMVGKDPTHGVHQVSTHDAQKVLSLVIKAGGDSYENISSVLWLLNTGI